MDHAPQPGAPAQGGGDRVHGLAGVEDHRQAQRQGQVQLRQEVALLGGPVQVLQVEIQAALSQGHGAGPGQALGQAVQVFRAVLIQEVRMQPVGRMQAPVGGSDLFQARPLGSGDAGDDDIADPGGPGPGHHRAAVRVQARVV